MENVEKRLIQLFTTYLNKAKHHMQGGSDMPNELVIGLHCRGEFESHRSWMQPRVQRGLEERMLFSSHKRAQIYKEAATSSLVAASSAPGEVREGLENRKSLNEPQNFEG
ncbi:unnamed protein product [Arabidopsis thaliana]|nr:unnamed protein product [Arabidopsis thaliana]